MQTLLPITIRSRFNSQHSSPSQTKSPTSSFQGKVIFTCGLMTAPRPIFAPNTRKTTLLSGDKLNGQNRNKIALVSSHRYSRNRLAPRSKCALENDERSTGIIPGISVEPFPAPGRRRPAKDKHDAFVRQRQTMCKIAPPIPGRVAPLLSVARRKVRGFAGDQSQSRECRSRFRLRPSKKKRAVRRAFRRMCGRRRRGPGRWRVGEPWRPRLQGAFRRSACLARAVRPT